MICPHCNLGIHLEFEEVIGFPSKDFEQTGKGYELGGANCPDCNGFIANLKYGTLEKGWVTNIIREEIIFPKHAIRPVMPEVPETFKSEFIEANAVLSVSPKASAALSRRILQNVLRENFNIQHHSLAKEIDDFIALKDVPSYLSEAVDAIRNVGNFAAHPIKDTNTGEIVEVEPGEADWLLEVLEILFDFAFVQPAKLKKQKDKLNKKLKSLGKPEMKG
ncbi:MAG: DUF4145 domain-containing protein [Ardenticatenaceae bacterium]|nr:DUF4145 domain-containing protein [Ardenticatenaceae bacterium]